MAGIRDGQWEGCVWAVLLGPQGSQDGLYVAPCHISFMAVPAKNTMQVQFSSNPPCCREVPLAPGTWQVVARLLHVHRSGPTLGFVRDEDNLAKSLSRNRLSSHLHFHVKGQILSAGY